MFHHVLKWSTPIGRKVLPKMKHTGAPLIRVKPKDILAAGIERVPRVAGVLDGLPLLDDDRTLDVANVIWCTGFRQDFSWIDLPIFDHDGEPEQRRGIVADQPGLYFMGLEYQYAFSSDVLYGVGRDAEYVAKHIAARQRTVAQPLQMAGS
jgi:putative flavoprotein involved in K+ transport